MEKALIIEEAGKYLLNNDKQKAIKILNDGYKFKYKDILEKNY